MARSNPICSYAIFAAGIVFVLLAFATPKAEAATVTNRSLDVTGKICLPSSSGNGNCLPAAGVTISVKSGDNRIIAASTTSPDGSLSLHVPTSEPSNLSYKIDINALLLGATFEVTIERVNGTMTGVPAEFRQ